MAVASYGELRPGLWPELQPSYGESGESRRVTVAHIIVTQGPSDCMRRCLRFVLLRCKVSSSVR